MRDYKIILFNILGNKCQNCDSLIQLCIHHKDGNSQNNEPSNIALLCRACHSWSLYRNGRPLSNRCKAGEIKILQLLEEGDKRWKDLEKASQIYFSSTTFADIFKRLKEAELIIRVEPSSHSHPVFFITDRGKEYLSKLLK